MSQMNDAPKFKNSISTDTIKFVSSFSEDGRASTMIFDNFIASIDASNFPSSHVQTSTFNYVRKIESTEDSLIRQDFRGSIATSGGSSASMIVHSGGQSTVIDLPKAIEDAKSNSPSETMNETRGSAAKYAETQSFSNDELEGEFNDFFVSISTPVSKGQSLQTTVIILVNRDEHNKESDAYIGIDSIDNEIGCQIQSN